MCLHMLPRPHLVSSPHRLLQHTRVCKFPPVSQQPQPIAFYKAVKIILLVFKNARTKIHIRNITPKLEVLREHRPLLNASSSQIWTVIRKGLPDPDSDADHHQNVTSWSLGLTQALHKISKSIGNFFDNPVNADFGLRTPGSGRWSRSSPKLNSLVPGPRPTPPRNFVKIRSQLFQLSDGQTDKQTNGQTDGTKNITSFDEGNNNCAPAAVLDTSRNLCGAPTTVCYCVELRELFCIYDIVQHVSFVPATQPAPSADDTAQANSCYYWVSLTVIWFISPIHVSSIIPV